MPTAGYSGTPLWKKLSLKPGLRVYFDGMPASVLAEIGDVELVRMKKPKAPIDAAHIFVTERAAMVAKLDALRPLLAPTGFIWVSWPRGARTKKLATDITEDVIRAEVLPGGELVDVKVCAVDAVWSGLKLMIRKERRA